LTLSWDQRVGLFERGGSALGVLLFGLPPNDGDAREAPAPARPRPADPVDADGPHAAEARLCARAQLLLAHAGIDLEWIAREAYGRPDGIESRVGGLIEHVRQRARSLEGFRLDAAAFEPAFAALAAAYRRLLRSQAVLDSLTAHLRWVQAERTRRATTRLRALIAARDLDRGRLACERAASRACAAAAERMLRTLLAERAQGSTGDARLDAALDAADLAAVARLLVAAARRQDAKAPYHGRDAAALAFWADATAALEACRAIARRDPEDLWAPLATGRLARLLRRPEVANTAFAEAERRADRRGEHGYRAAALLARAEIAGTCGHSRAALSLVRQAGVVLAGLGAAHPEDPERQRDRFVCLLMTGDIWRATGERGLARGAYDEALAIARTVAAHGSEARLQQRDLALALSMIGELDEAGGDLAGALRAYREARVIRERLAALDGADATLQRELAASLGKLGDVLQARGKLAGAERAYRRAFAVREAVAALDPADAAAQRNLVRAKVRLADVALRLGRAEEAVQRYREALTAASALGATDGEADAEACRPGELHARLIRLETG
jgi:tetratricopeptide (TPR) repeat protein